MIDGDQAPSPSDSEKSLGTGTSPHDKTDEPSIASATTDSGLKAASAEKGEISDGEATRVQQTCLALSHSPSAAAVAHLVDSELVAVSGEKGEASDTTIEVTTPTGHAFSPPPSDAPTLSDEGVALGSPVTANLHVVEEPTPTLSTLDDDKPNQYKHSPPTSQDKTTSKATSEGAEKTKEDPSHVGDGGVPTTTSSTVAAPSPASETPSPDETRKITRRWPRAPHGRVIEAEDYTGITAPNGIPNWGATVRDFYKVRRSGETPGDDEDEFMSGSMLAKMAEKLSEEEFALEEMERAREEAKEGPKRMEVDFLSEILVQQEENIRMGLEGESWRTEGEEDDGAPHEEDDEVCE